MPPKKKKASLPQEPIDQEPKPSVPDQPEAEDSDIDPAPKPKKSSRQIAVDQDITAGKPAVTEPHADEGSQAKKPGQPTVVRAAAPKPRRIPVWAWVVAGIVILSAAAIAGMVLFRPVPKTSTTTNTTDVQAEPLFPRAIDGVMVDEAKSNTNLYAVMIENAVDSRPPSGLDKASLVYETVAEGGITRFMAVYPLGESSKEIGPVRSARPYYVSWAEEYKALYVHVGGSPQALDYIKTGKAHLFDFNQFFRSTYFWRDRSRKAPHNVYTDTDKLFIGLRTTAKDYKPNYRPWKFQDEPGIESRPETVKDIVVDFSSFNYKAIWRYDRGQNRYLRFQGDDKHPHVTRTGEQMTAKNIAVQYVSAGLLPKERERLDITTVGEGKALLFRDGQVIEGTWKRAAKEDRTLFYDLQGNELMFDRGTTWVEAVPNGRTVTY